MLRTANTSVEYGTETQCWRRAVSKIVCSQANYIKRNINVYEPLKERMNNGAKAQQPPQSPPPPQTAARKPALRRLRCLQPSNVADRRSKRCCS